MQSNRPSTCVPIAHCTMHACVHVILLTTSAQCTARLCSARPWNHHIKRLAWLSVHPPDQIVDKVLTVSKLAILHKVPPLVGDALPWALQFERPQEVVGLLERGTHIVDLMDQIFNTDDVVLLTKGLLMEAVQNAG